MFFFYFFFQRGREERKSETERGRGGEGTGGEKTHFFSISFPSKKKKKKKKQADPNTGNILNFNVGAGIDLRVPRTFWSRLAGKYGTKSYWTKNGEAASIVNAVGAIDECLREPMGRLQCAKVGGPYVE